MAYGSMRSRRTVCLDAQSPEDELRALKAMIFDLQQENARLEAQVEDVGAENSRLINSLEGLSRNRLLMPVKWVESEFSDRLSLVSTRTGVVIAYFLPHHSVFQVQVDAEEGSTKEILDFPDKVLLVKDANELLAAKKQYVLEYLCDI